MDIQAQLSRTYILRALSDTVQDQDQLGGAVGRLAPPCYLLSSESFGCSKWSGRSFDTLKNRSLAT